MSELKLINIVKSAVLCENRIDDAQRLAQQKGIAKDFNEMVRISNLINPNHKYLNWIVKNFDVLKADPEQTIKVISYFDRHNEKFTKRSIDQYADFNELESTAERVSQQLRRDVPIIEGTRVLYDDYAFVVLIPETKAASCHYGAGSTWCTANKESDYYNTYRAQGELYYIISRIKPTSDNTYKMAVRMVFDDGSGKFPPVAGIAEIRDAQNKLLNESVLTENSSSNVLTAIRQDFNKKWDLWWDMMAEEMKKQKEAQSQKVAYERAQAAERQRIENQREAARRLARRNERDARREADEYEDNEEVYALREFLIQNGDWEGGDPEEAERLTNEITQLNDQIEAMERQLEEYPENEEMYDQLTQLRDRLDELEDELSEVTGYDIYELHQEGYEHYGLSVYTNEHDGSEWAIGTDEQADEAAYKQVESFIDEFRDQPGMGFNQGFIDNYVDGDQVAREMEDDIDNMVRESPDSYLDDDDKELTSEGEELLSEKQEALSTAETRKSTIEDRISEIESEMEELDPEENEDEYNQLDEELSDLNSELEDIESEISDLESEIEDIENGDDYKDYSEEAIQRAIDDRVEEIRRYPISTLNEWGITDLSPYIDEDELIQGVIDADGRGHGISSYDGEERDVTYNGTTYYIYRIN